jgi:hypothetical protein
MADVSVGDRHKFDLMTASRPHCRCSSTLVFSIVWVGTKADDSQCAFIGGLLGKNRGSEDSKVKQHH